MNIMTKADHKHGFMSPWKNFLDIENFFDRSLIKTTYPAINVSEDDKNIMVEVVAPGFKKDDFKLNCEEDILTISAEARAEYKNEDKEYSRREYNYNSFTRSFNLPDNVNKDKIAAHYSDGILNLTIPKTESKAKITKTIPID
jgi:HSP20 family protein